MYYFLSPGSICAPLDFDLPRRTDNLGVRQLFPLTRGSER